MLCAVLAYLYRCKAEVKDSTTISIGRIIPAQLVSPRQNCITCATVAAVRVLLQVAAVNVLPRVQQLLALMAHVSSGLLRVRRR